MTSDFTFKAIGTTWYISICDGSLDENEKETILAHITKFESQFSRFLLDSEVNKFRNAGAGKYAISDEFAVLLGMADKLRTLTAGIYDPAVGGFLEKVGYDNTYSLEPHEDVNIFSLPEWSLDKTTITLNGPVAFDLGGIGKGYCIDTVSSLLQEMGYKYFLVDAGGDMYATTKQDGSAWRVAIQYPGKPDTAAGTVNLENQAIAVSDSFRRRWGVWHHIVNPQKREAIEGVIGAVAVAQNAWHADCMTSALFLAPQEKYKECALEFKSEYLVFLNDGTCKVSSNWKGELF